MSGSVPNLGTNLAGMRSALGPQQAALGLSRGQEVSLMQEAAAARSLPPSKDGNVHLASG